MTLAGAASSEETTLPKLRICQFSVKHTNRGLD